MWDVNVCTLIRSFLSVIYFQFLESCLQSDVLMADTFSPFLF